MGGEMRRVERRAACAGGGRNRAAPPLAFAYRIGEAYGGRPGAGSHRRGFAMRLSQLKLGSALLVLAAMPALSACTPKVSGLDCAAIADQAKQLSQGQTVKISSVANVHETSRTDTDARCEGNATLSDGSNQTVYLRAYEENGNTMVAYQPTPFQ
jgi:hypothetical protein